MERQFLDDTMIKLRYPNTFLRPLILSFSVLAGCQTASELHPLPTETETNRDANPQIAVTKPPPQDLADQRGGTSEVVIDNLWHRLRQGFQLQHYYDHPAVQPYIDNYSQNQRLFDLVTQRASPFLFYIVEEVEKRDLPLELALLPIVESTFNPIAASGERAVGLWQFMAPTASSFGVQQDWWYDGRRDPIVSTAAALEYLSQLHKQFAEDWLVAIGAYNTGDGNVRRAIRRSKQDLNSLDFWALPLAPETRSHVPKLLALAAVVSNVDQHEVSLERIPNRPQLGTIELTNQIDLAQAASLANLTISELKFLNPGYLQWATHPDSPQSLMLPLEKVNEFEQAIAKANPENFMTWDRYQIQPGDTLGQIARNLNTRVDVLQTVNGITGSRIVAGDSLLIPRNINSLSQMNSAAEFKPVSLGSRRQTETPIPPELYAVKRGDNLWSIARKFDLKSAAVAKLNDIALDSLLQPGQILRLTNPTPVTQTGKLSATDAISFYAVQRGDSIASIAKKSGHRIDDLLRWNSLQQSQIIYPGQLIRLTPPESGIN